MTPCSWKSQTWIVSPFLEDKRLGAGVSHEFSVKLLAETSVIARLGWGKICFHTCSHDFWQCSVSYRLLTRDLCSSSTWVAWWIFTTWLMDSPGASDSRESGKGEWEGPRQMPWCLLGFIFHLCVNNISRSHAFFIKYHVFQERRDFNLFPWENYRPSF